MYKKNRKTERGNVVFFILIGVVLFAALSFAVSQMMRSGNPNEISEQKARLYANEVLDYARAVRQAVQHVRLTNECDAAEVSFENSVVTGYTNAGAPGDNRCDVFDANGGTMTYIAPAEDWLDTTKSASTSYGEWYFPENVCVNGIGASGASGCESDTADNEDLIVIIPYIKREICEQINKSLGITPGGGAPPVEIANAWPAGFLKFDGSFTDGTPLNQDGQMSGCFEGSAANTPPAGTYHFFQVLWPR